MIVEVTDMASGNTGPSVGFPQVSYLAELRARQDLQEVSFEIDFPLLTDPEVRRLSGSKGSPFGSGIHKRMFFDEAHRKLLVRVPLSPLSSATAAACLVACLVAWLVEQQS